MSNRRLNKSDAPKHLTDHEMEVGVDDFIVSKTDTKGSITYFNRVFLEMAGYTKAEMMGANHNLIRHPDMPAIAFKLAWDLIKSGQEFFGFVKNLRKNGGFYWVFAYITADHDDNGSIIGYTSVRIKPSRAAIEAIVPLYKLLVEEERRGGMEASSRLLTSYLEEHKTTYDELVTALQKAGDR